MHDTSESPARRLPIGAEPCRSGTHFRVWAPRCRTVEVIIENGSSNRTISLAHESNGYFAGLIAGVAAGDLYRFRLDEGSSLYPDPASRFQPDGPHGPSKVVDPSTYQWTDSAWQQGAGVAVAGQVIYELHIGAFTHEGTWQAAAERLEHLRDVGVTLLELMPISEFAGRFGWGYDGVDLFATTRLYGSPDDFRRFVDRAHAIGLGVILDVVYNHLGPDGNYLTQFSDHYITKRHRTDWGAALNFDDEGSPAVREFFLSNARMWIEEYHLDGFRFDATQAIVDSSPQHILAEISVDARRAARGKRIYMVNENEPQHTRLVTPVEQGGYGMDSLWNDDFHHSAMVALTGHREAYFTDHPGQPQEFVSAAKWGYLYQGQRYAWQNKRRGTSALTVPPTSFVHFIQNHDQIANSARGLRAHLLASPGEFRAMTALLLLMPQTPMLFMGQEFAADAPFLYFADHHPELAAMVRKGRARELAQFPSIATDEAQARLDEPGSPNTFEKCKLDWSQVGQPGHDSILRLHRDLLRLRREEAVLRRVQRRGDVDGAVLGPKAFLLRFFSEEKSSGARNAGDDDRLLLVNLGDDLSLVPAPEPLLAPPQGQRWAVQLSTEDPAYSGFGTAAPDTEQEGWLLAGGCALLLQPMPEETARVTTRVHHSGSSQAARPIEAHP